MKAEPATPPAVVGLLMTGAAGTLFPVRLAKVDDPPLLKRILAVLAPSDCGVNRTAALQLAVLATIPLQVVETTWKSAISVPVISTAIMLIVPVELLINVTDCDGELVSTVVFGNDTGDGTIVAA